MSKVRPYVTMEYRCLSVNSEWKDWQKIKPEYSDVYEQIFDADRLAADAAEDMKAGKIVDFQIEY